ncbi:4818_t:CDS:2 [Diversispora eburnea]|uniref:4818_t:CDS:1 n=1 Tax=Diversispora eburnea TaxID=1213867 RepID=A0A9N9ARN1_9GLOM|nr:4818_t:CDS:2 [Diversispora eburnea]
MKNNCEIYTVSKSSNLEAGDNNRDGVSKEGVSEFVGVNDNVINDVVVIDDVAEPPVPGAIRITLQAPSGNISVPSYCSGGSLGCTFWGANEIQYPNDGAGFAFFTTRAYAAKYSPPASCNFLNVSNPNDECFFNQKTANTTEILPKSYIGGIEDYTMMIEHSIRGKATSIAIRNGLLDGQLLSSDRKTVVETFTNASRTAKDPNADGDIISIRQMLQAANANLDALSTAPGASDGETYRSSGIVIVVVIEYKNVAFKKVATAIVELLMLHFLPEKDHYSHAVIEHTHDFEDLRRGLVNKEDIKNRPGPDTE